MWSRWSARTELRLGLPVISFTSGDRTVDKEIQVLAQRLAKHGLLEYRLGRSRKDDDLVVIEPQLPDYRPRWRFFATLTNSSCRGSRIRDGVAARWCWNRLAPERCSEFAIPMWRPPWPYSLHRNKSNNSVDGTTLPALSFLPSLLIAKSFSRRKTLVTMACDLPRETTISYFRTFTIFFSIRGHGRPDADPLGGVYPYAGSFLLPATRAKWPGKKIDLSKVSAGRLAASSSAKTLLLGVVRPGALMPIDR